MRGRRIKADIGALVERRAYVLALISLLVLAAITGRYAYLQLWRHDDYVARADNNRIRILPLPPVRGRIFDRNGVQVAENLPSFRLDVIREQAGELEPYLDRLATTIDLSAEQRALALRQALARQRFVPFTVKLDLSESERARFAVNRHRFPGAEVVPYLKRHYPTGAALAHVLGYVGRLDEADLGRVDRAAYAGTSHIGKLGLEQRYEELLHGLAGQQTVEVNVAGRVVRTLAARESKAGVDLHLTIDSELQIEAMRAFGQNTGALVAIEPATGDVLALVSVPGYDPNPFVGGIDRLDYQALLADPERPLFNRALTGTYEPGSTIKPFVGLAALAHGVRGRDQRVLSTGVFQLPGTRERYRDWKRTGHGEVDLAEALAQSVNTYFYGAAAELGIDRLHDYLRQFDFGGPTLIDMPGEASGLLPSRAWKLEHLKQRWFPGETVIVGIGQGYFTTTPLQLAQATAVLASGGHKRVPRLVRGVGPQPVRWLPPAPAVDLQLSEADLARVVEGMRRVVHGSTGTARAMGEGLTYSIAAKTGTAQVYTRRTQTEYEEAAIARHLRHNALLVAYAPLEEPRIAIAVIVEHGSSGTRAAAPLARRVLDYYLRRAPPESVAGD